MGKIVDLKKYRTKQLEKNNMTKYIEGDLPKIYITKVGEHKYNIIVSNSGENTLFNKKPMSKLSVAIYAASYCKDKLSEYLEENLSTDIIVFDKNCANELNIE